MLVHIIDFCSLKSLIDTEFWKSYALFKKKKNKVVACVCLIGIETKLICFINEVRPI